MDKERDEYLRLERVADEANVLISRLTQRLAKAEAEAYDYRGRWEAMQDVLPD